MKPCDAKHLLLYLVYGKPPGLYRFRFLLNWLGLRQKNASHFSWLGNGRQLKGQSVIPAMLELPGWGWQALGLIDGNEALAIFGLGQFLLGYVDAQDAVFELGGNVVF